MDDPAGPPLLLAEELVVGYGSPVCAPVSLRLAPGRALAVVGPNGAGKSTLLATLGGLLPQLGGEARFAGSAIDERSSSFRRDVAALLDDDAFFATLTGREHLLLTARGHGVLDAEAVVEQEIAAFGLTDRIDALPSNLSSGQRRRLALAAAFVRPARLLLLDEPERRLDPGMRARLGSRLAGRRDAGASVLFATHDRDLVAAVADDVVAVDDDACRHLGPADGAAFLDRL